MRIPRFFLNPYFVLAVIALLFSFPILFLFKHFQESNQSALQDFRNEASGVAVLRSEVLYVPSLSSSLSESDVLQQQESHYLQEIQNVTGKLTQDGGWRVGYSGKGLILGPFLNFLSRQKDLIRNGVREPHEVRRQRLRFVGEMIREGMLDASGLILDPDLATYWLMSIHLDSLPSFRDEVLGIFFEKAKLAASSHWNLKKTELENELARMERHVFPMDDLVKADAFQWTGSVVEYRRLFDEVKHAVESVFAAGKPADIALFFERFRAYQEKGLELFNQLNEVRIRRLKSFNDRSGRETAIAWLLAALIALGFSRFVSTSERARRRLEKQLVDADKMAALGQMAGEIGHEIGNPLSVIQLQAQMIQVVFEQEKRPADDFVNQGISKILNNSQRIGNIMKSLRTFSRSGGADPLLPTPVKDLFMDLQEITGPRVKSQNVHLEVEIPKEEAVIRCRASEMLQILVNLVSNAADAVQGLPLRWIRVDCVRSEKAVDIRVTDSGGGIPPEARARLFEPFFTTKGVGKGTGLGLSISRRIAEAHGGELLLDDTSPNTRFVIRLPISV